MAKKPEKQLSPERKALISKLIDEFDIRSAKDIEDMFKDMFSPMLQEMLEGELDDHLGYERYEHSGESGLNSHNGHSSKKVTTSFGDMDLEVPRDRNSTFEPQVVKKAVYIAIGIRLDGMKEVMGMYIGGNESAKYWLGVLNDLKARGVKDILVCCVDGLSGFCDAIATVYPQTDIQRCIIHQIRSSTRFVVSKDMKSFVSDLKKVYRANTQEDAWEQLDAFDSKWGKKYPAAVKSWRDSWNELTSFFQYPYEMRSLIYTTNAIEGFNRQLRKVTKTRTVFPADDSLFKLLFLAMRDITAKWYGKPHNWGLIVSQLMISFPDRISDEDFA